MTDLNIDNLIVKLVGNMLALEPDTSFFIHFVDSDQMGIDLLSNDILPVINESIIGIGGARIRHKIAYNLGLPIDNFKFLLDHTSELEIIEPGETNLVLWDYLNLVQPAAERVVYRKWKRVDLIVVVPQLVESTPNNSNLKSLVKPEMLGR